MIVLLMACGQIEGNAVRTTLSDGQVLVGEVRTNILNLETALGALPIPLEDVGEIVPVEGAHLAASNQYVTVWLRNGSELRGRWAEPELSLDVEAGETPVQVELPIGELTRLQTPGELSWPDDTIFRVETTHGDDLLVNAAETAVTFVNELGTFSPTLKECASLEPIGDPKGDWRVTLHTGTVLVGKLQHEALNLALPMGPEQVSVPVAQLKRLSWQRWGAQDQYQDFGKSRPASVAAPGWFSSGSAERAKTLN